MSRQPDLFDRPRADPRPIRRPPWLDVAYTARRRMRDGKVAGLDHPCGLCGATVAPFGRAVDLRRALASGKRKAAGQWLCRECWEGRRP